LPTALLVLFAALLLCGCATPPAEWPPPPVPEQLVIRAQGLNRLGDPAAALAELEMVFEIDPDHLWAHRVRQDALIASGRSREARELYLAMAGERPQSAQFAYLAGRILLPDSDAARPYFEQSLLLDPSFAWARIGLAQLQVIRGDLFRAVRIHVEDDDVLDEAPDLQMSLGLLYLQIGLVRDAQRALELALQHRPWDPRIHAGLGKVNTELGRDQEAIQHLVVALEIDPSRTDLMGALARIHYERGDLDRAWEVCVHHQEVDGTAEPRLVWNLEAATGRTMPHFAVLGPHALDREVDWSGSGGR